MSVRNKKISALIVLLIVTLSFIGCGGNSSEDAGTGDANTTETAVTAEVTTDSAIVSDSAVTSDEAIDDQDDSSTDENDQKKDGNNTKSSSSSSSSSKSSENTKKDNKKDDTKSSNEIKVSISIDCKTLYQKDPDLASKVSSNGTILGKKTLTLAKNATVWDALRKTGISFTGSNYISTINGLSEKDGGKLSGWMFKINGAVPMESCDEYKLKSGDNIQWRYTLSSGDDI